MDCGSVGGRADFQLPADLLDALASGRQRGRLVAQHQRFRYEYRSINEIAAEEQLGLDSATAEVIRDVESGTNVTIPRRARNSFLGGRSALWFVVSYERQDQRN